MFHKRLIYSVMDVFQIPKMAELITLSESSDIKKGVENASLSGTKTFTELSNSTLSPQCQVSPMVNSPIISPLSSESDFQEVDRNNEEAEDISSNDTEMLKETSNSILSHEHQNLPVVVSPMIINSLSESDSQELNSNDEEITHSTISDGLSQPDLLGPKPIVMVERLTEKAIEELSEGIWRCSSCGKAEKSYLILDLHIDTGCEELSPIECDICPAVVREYSNFVVHFMEHKMGGTRRCPICLQEPITDLKQHLILEDHFSINVSNLDLLDNTSPADSLNPSTSGCSNSLESDYEAKRVNNQNECLNARLQGKKQRKFERRQRIKTAKKTYKCNSCNKCFSYPRNLKNHQRLHTGEKQFKCGICQKIFVQKSNFNIHQRVHTGEKPFKCHLCQKKFSRLSHLNKHQRMHTGEKPFECDACQKRFADSSGLNLHQRVVHTGEKPYKCGICQKSFSQKGHFNIHQRVHTGERPFKCDVCQKRFVDSSGLIVHQRVHTGEKPFECDICEKRYSQAGDLKKHLRVHTGEKLFKCDACQKRFFDSSALNVHRRVHTGEKPFKCDACNKAFSQSANLNKHQRLHIGEKPF
ncbi:zinc finger protein ZFP2-like isoform X2 [Artemia franciscana]|uniref:zinc finger protein ZFP2-like isoform X2 n=1 Tax=Artemia franciscana TaxID=6661 RepID=UPI0032DA6FA3